MCLVTAAYMDGVTFEVDPCVREKLNHTHTHTHFVVPALSVNSQAPYSRLRSCSAFTCSGAASSRHDSSAYAPTLLPRPTPSSEAFHDTQKYADDVHESRSGGDATDATWWWARVGSEGATAV